MNKFTSIASTSVLSVVIAGSMVGQALACHPQGQITKSVQNITAGGEAAAADTAAAAITAKPGDILRYTIEVSNTAAAGDNDLTSAVMTDTLPAGVELTSDPAVMAIKVEMPTIKPGTSVTKQYEVKVTSTTDGKVIENKACYTANNRLNNLPQSGCNSADVKVSVPVVTPTPTPVTPTPAPVTPAAPTTPAGTGSDTPAAAAITEPDVLPNAGVGSSAAVIGVTSSVFGYIAYALYLKRRTASDFAA